VKQPRRIRRWFSLSYVKRVRYLRVSANASHEGWGADADGFAACWGSVRSRLLSPTSKQQPDYGWQPTPRARGLVLEGRAEHVTADAEL